jgi:hypothetical protein
MAKASDNDKTIPYLPFKFATRWAGSGNNSGFGIGHGLTSRLSVNEPRVPWQMAKSPSQRMLLPTRRADKDPKHKGGKCGPPCQCIDHARADAQSVNSSMVKAQESTLKDFAKRFERGKLSFTGDVLQV